MAAVKPTHFTAQVIKVETMSDGAIRLVLDLSESSIEAAAAMMKAKQQSALVECAALFVKPQLVIVRQNEERKTSRSSPYIEARKESKGSKGKTKQ